MSNLGIELELAVLLAFAVLGAETFAPFEVETPAWKKILKWVVVTTITLGLYPTLGHWAALVATAFGLVGLVYHFIWCAKNEIHPIRATPRRRYYQLRGWEWPEE